MGYQALIVEDDHNNQFLYKMVLSKYQFDVITVDNGSEALNLLEDYTPDLILIDIFLPRMDGMELLYKVRQLPHLDQALIWVISAIKEPTLDPALRANFQKKPILPSHLKDIAAQVSNFKKQMTI